jgi:hypothetical protein
VKPATVRISPKELQDKFNNNEGGYPARLEELAFILSHDKPAHPSSGQPLGTRSQVRKYKDKQQTVMVLHCFKLPSGGLGASGKMDPKGLLVGDTFFFC